MPYISVEEHLPGITGLLEYRKESAQPIRELTQLLLRGPSTLTQGERALIATVVSHNNECRFCTTAHTAAADLLLGDYETTQKVKENIETAPVSEKMKALLAIASSACESGKSVTPEMISKAKKEGATEREIHDTVLIAAMFCMYNRYVDGLATVAPTDPEYYRAIGKRLKNSGYHRPQQGYNPKQSLSTN